MEGGQYKKRLNNFGPFQFQEKLLSLYKRKIALFRIFKFNTYSYCVMNAVNCMSRTIAFFVALYCIDVL